jgi:subtilase family serine protease
LKRILTLTILLSPAIWLAGCGGSNATTYAPAALDAASRSSSIHTNVVVRSRGFHPDVPSGWSPADLEAAYDLPSSSQGSGQIVAVVDAYDNPNVVSDLASYRSTFGLPPANLTKYNQAGQTGNYPQGSPNWGVEIDLDVEMLAASCPNCTIDLVEANSNGSKDLDAAVAEAVKLGAHVVSVSWSCEGSDCVDKSYFNAKGVEYLASGGDIGSGVAYPSALDSVVATGGTVLTKGGGGKRGWTESVGPGDGGCTNVRRPKWQHDPYCKHRLTNDVASVATNIAEYDSYDQGGWITVEGTSASAPFLAGVFGLAGNAAAQKGGRTFWQAAHHKYLYPVERGASSCAYATGRYNTCTGWGTPHGIGAF